MRNKGGRRSGGPTKRGSTRSALVMEISAAGVRPGNGRSAQKARAARKQVDKLIP